MDGWLADSLTRLAGPRAEARGSLGNFPYHLKGENCQKQKSGLNIETKLHNLVTDIIPMQCLSSRKCLQYVPVTVSSLAKGGRTGRLPGWGQKRGS